MRAVAYIRVSTEEQVSGTSLDSQEKACLEYARKEGIVLKRDDIFREEGVSAKLITRPKLAQMIKHCAQSKGEITHCIVWKVDRLARKSEYHHVIKAQLARHGVKLVSVTEPIGDDPIGNLMDGMLAAFAQFDNDIRTVRTTGGMKARTMQGGWPHSAPYGYKSARTPAGVVTVTPSEDAPRLTEFLNEFSTGAYTVKQAADLAAEIGIRGRTGKTLHWQSVKNLITNPLYAGFVRTRLTDNELITGLHKSKALITEQVYYKNQAIIGGNLKNWSREAVEEWPLRSGFLRHTCGKAMTGSSPTARNGSGSPRYSCPACKARILKRQVSKQRELVHSEFIELLNTTRPNQGAQKLFKEIVLRQWNDEFKHGLEHSTRLDGEHAELRKKKSRVIDLFIDGKLSDQEKQAKMDEIESHLNELELQRLDATEYVSNKEQVIDGALLFMSNPGLFWNRSGLEIKKRVQDSIFPEGLEYDCETGFGTAQMAQSYLVIQQIADNSAKNPNLVGVPGFEPGTNRL